MTQLTSNTQAFVHKEQYDKSTKKGKKTMKPPMKKAAPKKDMTKKKPMKKMAKPKKQGY